jgi:hypothetical protein
MFTYRLDHSDDQVGIEAFKKTVTLELEHSLKAKRQLIDHVKPATEQRPGAYAFRDLKEEALRKFNDSKSAVTRDPLRTLSLTTHGGLSISTPPYDVAWTSSPVWDEADRANGTFKVTTIDDLGYQAAGIGLFVTTTKDENVRFSADAIFHAQWTDLVVAGGNLGFGAASSDGGCGVLVYEGGNRIARSDARLWSDYQSGTTLHGKSDDTTTLLTQTQAGQTYFHMMPGRQYLVWIWAWTTVAFYGEALAIAIIDAQVPFVVLQQV